MSRTFFKKLFLTIWVRPNKGTKYDIGLGVISGAHDGLPAGIELPGNG